jgi:hypothetical protein
VNRWQRVGAMGVAGGVTDDSRAKGKMGEARPLTARQHHADVDKDGGGEGRRPWKGGGGERFGRRVRDCNWDRVEAAMGADGGRGKEKEWTRGLLGKKIRSVFLFFFNFLFSFFFFCHFL